MQYHLRLQAGTLQAHLGRRSPRQKIELQRKSCPMTRFIFDPQPIVFKLSINWTSQGMASQLMNETMNSGADAQQKSSQSRRMALPLF